MSEFLFGGSQFLHALLLWVSFFLGGGVSKKFFKGEGSKFWLRLNFWWGPNFFFLGGVKIFEFFLKFFLINF